MVNNRLLFWIGAFCLLFASVTVAFCLKPIVRLEPAESESARRLTMWGGLVREVFSRHPDKFEKSILDTEVFGWAVEALGKVDLEFSTLKIDSWGHSIKLEYLTDLAGQKVVRIWSIGENGVNERGLGDDLELKFELSAHANHGFLSYCKSSGVREVIEVSFIEH